MGFHTFDPERAANLEDASRFRYCSRDELVAALDPEPEDRVADLGSGTGFYTREVAPFVGRVDAVDVQPQMHEEFRDRGVPENVSLVTADVADLPFGAGELDGAFSTMTFHEFASAESLAAVHRVLAEGGPFVAADWSAAGEGEDGPPVDERFDAEDAADLLADAGFAVERATDRPETLFVVARA
ncbi:class I SAM-dependent methyltransferase [Halobacterium yunchengense]|uniref:class I SAM-dependent methyltransferase n=1 Tax=Halobacterium yunchengense TaxID=3108497 RepID=UPI00300B2265